MNSRLSRSNGEGALGIKGERGRVLIFNFFGGVLLRGIPMYIQNLRIALEQEDVACYEIRCPVFLRRLPRPCLNLLFVVFEQFVAPVRGLAYDRVIYPYNSVSLAGSAMGRSILVIHDFIPNSFRNTKFSARYIRTTQKLHALMGRDIAYVSRTSARIGKRLGMFSRSRLFFFPNSFFSFVRTPRSLSSPQGEHVLLCTGWGTNKDLPGALELYRESGLWRRRKLRIIGISGHQNAVDVFLTKNPEMKGHITVLPRLTYTEVVDEYCSAAWVWVHSAKEGYGRSIAEAKLCGCRIVASDIGPFREQRDDLVFLYFGLDKFMDALARCEALPRKYTPREPQEHEILCHEIKRFLQTIYPQCNGEHAQQELG